MATTPVGSAGTPATANGSQSSQSATDAFGLGFEDLLKIVLTQLTYQDPLKPMDNYQFVSQLAQFSQIQQTQAMADSLNTLVSAQASLQAAALLGKIVDVPTSDADTVLSGKVTAIAFGDAGPTLTIQSGENQSVSNINLGAVTQIREATD